jgi:Sulfotransferase domain
MHKAASTFVADVLLPSIAIRTAQYNLYNVGSKLIKFRDREEREKGRVPEWVSLSQYDQLMHFFQHEPLPASNGLIGRVYPGHLPAIEQSLGIKLPDPNHRLVIVRRDPRDALVSLYYSITISHNPTCIEGDQARFQESRERLRAKSVREGIMTILENAGKDVITQEFLSLTSLLQNDSHVCDLPYELLIDSPQQWLSQFVEFGELEKYVDDNWHTEMLVHLQPPAVEDPSSHKRRMKPGNWKAVFDEELRAMLGENIRNRMDEFGYCWDDDAQTELRRAA